MPLYKFVTMSKFASLESFNWQQVCNLVDEHAALRVAATAVRDFELMPWFKRLEVVIYDSDTQDNPSLVASVYPGGIIALGPNMAHIIPKSADRADDRRFYGPGSGARLSRLTACQRMAAFAYSQSEQCFDVYVGNVGTDHYFLFGSAVYIVTGVPTYDDVFVRTPANIIHDDQ